MEIVACSNQEVPQGFRASILLHSFSPISQNYFHIRNISEIIKYEFQRYYGIEIKVALFAPGPQDGREILSAPSFIVLTTNWSMSRNDTGKRSPQLPQRVIWWQIGGIMSVFIVRVDRMHNEYS